MRKMSSTQNCLNKASGCKDYSTYLAFSSIFRISMASLTPYHCKELDPLSEKEKAWNGKGLVLKYEIKVSFFAWEFLILKILYFLNWAS